MTAEKQPINSRMAEIIGRLARRLRVIGSLITAAGVIWMLLRLGFLLYALPATGVVERVEQRSDSSMWHARFTYPDRDGRRHTAEMSFLSPSLCPSVTVGNSVPVRYSADSPDQALIVTAGTLWFGPGALLALGFFFVVGGRLLRFVARITSAKADQQARG